MAPLAGQRHDHEEEEERSKQDAAVDLGKLASQTKGGVGNFLGRAAMGGAAAMSSKVIAAPLERVKLLLQSQDELISQGRLDRRYEGIGDCFKRVYRSEGIPAFWRGTSANVLRIGPTHAVNFSCKPLYNKVFGVAADAPFFHQLVSKVASGGAAGATSALVTYPLDMARTRLANDTRSADGSRRFTGILDVWRQIYKVDGIPGLYRGIVPSLYGAMAYRGVEFGLYDCLKPIWLQGSLESSFAASFALGYFCTVTAGLAVYPFDSVRRRMMMSSGGAKNYHGFLDAFASIIRTSGVRSLYSGAGANILRGIAGAGALSGYDAIQRFATRVKSSYLDASSSSS
ncbi:hypothetical protein V8E36_007878 [Tilletia maclaganii]